MNMTKRKGESIQKKLQKEPQHITLGIMHGQSKSILSELCFVGHYSSMRQLLILRMLIGNL